MARHDFQVSANACSSLIRLVTSDQDPLYFHLYTSAVIAYAKPFVHSNLGRLKGEWERFPESWMSTVHANAVDARNQVIAHNDPSIRQMWVSPGASRTHPDTLAWDGVPTFFVSSYNMYLDFFPRLQSLCNYQMLRLTYRLRERMEEMHDLASLPVASFQITKD